MIIRTLAVATLALVAASLTACNNDKHSDNGSMSAKSNMAHNKSCLVCGMNADAHYTVWQDGKAANCCSQACCDKFNNSSTADKQRMMNNAWSKSSSMSTNDNYNGQYASMENKNCPMSGHEANGKYVVDEDGHRIGFCSQQCADTYRAMSPEHRAEVRSKAMQQN